MKTREEVTAMSDGELLIYYRRKHGNPYMVLSMAKEMRRADYKWMQLHEAARQQRTERQRRAEVADLYGFRPGGDP